jgi:protocatechuate 3,4-dioxygenase alpha subunit
MTATTGPWTTRPSRFSIGPRPHRTHRACSRGWAPATTVLARSSARGLLRHLHTRIYFEGDPALRTDPVLALVPESRRGTLLARREQGNGDRWRFDIRLQGADETVFFDL